MVEVLNNLSPNKKKMLELAKFGYMTATDLADYLVKNHNIVTLNHIEYSDYVVSFMFLPVLSTTVKLWMILLISFRGL